MTTGHLAPEELRARMKKARESAGSVLKNTTKKLEKIQKKREKDAAAPTPEQIAMRKTRELAKKVVGDVHQKLEDALKRELNIPENYETIDLNAQFENQEKDMNFFEREFKRINDVSNGLRGLAMAYLFGKRKLKALLDQPYLLSLRDKAKRAYYTRTENTEKLLELEKRGQDQKDQAIEDIKEKMFNLGKKLITYGSKTEQRAESLYKHARQRIATDISDEDTLNQKLENETSITEKGLGLATDVADKVSDSELLQHIYMGFKETMEVLKEDISRVKQDFQS